MKNLLKSENLTDLLWTAFGVIGALNYYKEGKYLICGLLTLIAVLYAFKLIKSIKKHKKVTV